MDASNLSGGGVCKDWLLAVLIIILGGVTGAALEVDTDPGVEGANGDVAVVPRIESVIEVCGDDNSSSFWRAVMRQKLGDID